MNWHRSKSAVRWRNIGSTYLHNHNHKNQLITLSSNCEIIYIEKDSPLTNFNHFYSDFLFFGFFLGSSPLSRSRLIFFRAPSIILPEVGKERIFLGSSTPAGFTKVVDVEVVVFLRDGARRSVPTPPLSKMACRAVFVSFSSKPLIFPDVPEADIVIGLGCIFRFEDDSGASAVVVAPESWTTSGVES